MNYYEMLGLPCDGQDANNINLIRQKLAEWKQAKETAHANEQNNMKKTALKAELDEYPKMELLLTDPGLRKQHAEELKNQRTGQTASIVDIIAQCSTQGKRISRSRVQRLAAQVGLQMGTVSKIFKDKGFEVVLPTPAATKDFVFPENDGTIIKFREGFAKFKAFFATHAMDKNAAVAQANNLYDYIAILDGGSIQTSDEYRFKPTDALRDLFEKQKRQHAMGADVFTQTARDIETAAATMVFKDDNTRKKYDNYLKLTELQSLFAMLSVVPNTVKLEPSFAAECVRRIQRVFNDEDQAIALYNSFSGLPQDMQYEKESAQLTFICASCHMENDFPTLEAAQKGKCKCGASLFQTCSKCGALSPAVADYCVKCGFFFKGTKVFELYYQRFALAISGMNLDAAEDAFIKAKQCNPAEPRLPDMKNKLDGLVKDLKKPIQEIDAAIGDRKFNLAQNLVSKLLAARPGVNLSQYQAQITKALTEAKQLFARIQPATPEGQALEICMSVTNTVADYQPAQEWLRRHPPKPVAQVVCQPDVKGLSCTLQWADHPDNRYVKYTVVRKIGARPQNSQDGETVAREQTARVFKDTGLKPGVAYTYAVFAKRGDSESAPCHLQSAVILLKCIEAVNVNVSDGKCALSWSDIPGSRGVRIQRVEPGKLPVTLSPCARAMFTDTSIKNGVTYRYVFDTVWELNQKIYYSELSKDTLTRDVRAEQKPPRTDIRLTRVGLDGNCEVNWIAKGEGALRLIQLAEGINVTPDQVYGAAQMQKMGEEIVAAVPVAAGHYAWYAPVGRQFRVAGFRLFGDEAVGGAPIVINTVPPLMENADKLTIGNNVLSFSLVEVPSGVTALYYMLSTGGQVLTEEMALRNTATRMDAADYRKNGCIRVENVPQGMITVSVLALYGAGKGAYCSPVRSFQVPNMPKADVRFRIEWPMGGFPRRPVRKGAKLYVSVSGERMPDMYLCCLRDGKMLFKQSPGDPNVVVLAHVTAGDARPSQEKSFDIDENALRGVPAGTPVKLLLADREVSFFNIPATTNFQSTKLPAP